MSSMLISSCAFLDVVADADVAQADHAVERRLDPHPADLGLGQLDGSLLHLQRGRGVVERLLADEFLFQQFLVALVVVLRQRQIGPRLLQFRLLDGGVERDQQRAPRVTTAPSRKLIAAMRPGVSARRTTDSFDFSVPTALASSEKSAAAIRRHLDGDREAAGVARRPACSRRHAAARRSSRRPVRRIGVVAQAEQPGRAPGQ